MSEQVLRLIPRDPTYLPPPAAQERAAELLRRLLPDAREVCAVVHDEVSFIDQGGNFESLACPSCRQPLDLTWWSEMMGVASERSFADLVVRVPCCGSSLSLNDLEYDWPAGFARFVLEASDSQLGGWLDPGVVAEIEGILGTPVRQILAHY